MNQPQRDHGQPNLVDVCQDLHHLHRGLEMMDEMIRCKCSIELKPNKMVAIINTDGTEIVEAARLADLFIWLSKGK